MNIFKTIFIFLFILLFCFCHKEQSQQVMPKSFTILDSEKILVQRSNDIGFNYFGDLIELQKFDDNLLISPIGISISFNALIEASGIKTKSEIKRYMQIQHLADSSVKAGFDHLHEIFEDIDKNTFLSTSDNFAFSQKIKCDKTFSDFLEKRKYVSISFDPNNRIIPGEMNSESFDINSFQLVNSVNFDARPKFQQRVEEMPFYYMPGSSGFVEMIVSESMYNYYGDASIKSVEIPLGRGNFNMLIIVPQGTQSLNELALKLNMRLVNKIRGKYKARHLEVCVPKLDISIMESFCNILKNRHLSNCFLKNTNNFSGLNKDENYFLSDVQHIVNFKLNYKSNADLDEVNYIDQNDKNEMSSFLIDHPFLFVIYEKYADGILFVGKVVKP